jgi:hypothetical protein
MVTDYMVFNVTKEDIRVRMAAVDEEIWPQFPLIAVLISTRKRNSLSEVGHICFRPKVILHILRDFRKFRDVFPLPFFRCFCVEH